MNKIQEVVDKAYTKYNNQNYVDFVESLNDKERLAVLVGDLNSQVENGGLGQWDFNGYSDKVYDLVQYLEKYKEKSNAVKDILEILERFIKYKMDYNDAEYDEDLGEDDFTEEEFEEVLDDLDRLYYKRNDKFLSYIEKELGKM